MNYAIVRGTQFLRYELDDGGAIPPGCTRYPVEVGPQPEHDPALFELESAPAIDASRGVVVIVYTAVPRPQMINPPSVAGQTIIQQADTSELEAQVAALKAVLAQMQRKPLLDLAFIAVHSDEPGEPEKAREMLRPAAEQRGLTVDAYIAELLAERRQATEQALKGAA